MPSSDIIVSNLGGTVNFVQGNYYSSPKSLLDFTKKDRSSIFFLLIHLVKNCRKLYTIYNSSRIVGDKVNE